MMVETSKIKPNDNKLPQKIVQAHNGAVERYMKELQLKAKEEKRYINEAKRL